MARTADMRVLVSAVVGLLTAVVVYAVLGFASVLFVTGWDCGTDCAGDPWLGPSLIVLAVLAGLGVGDALRRRKPSR